MRWKALAAMVWLVGAAGAASGNPLRDSPGPRAIAVGEAMRAAAHGTLATTLNPAGVVLSRAYVIEAAYGYKPDDAMSTLNIAVCDSTTSRVGACLSYEYLTADPALDDGDGDANMHLFSLVTGVPLSQSIMLGSTTRYVRWSESMSEENPVDTSRNSFLWDAGLIVRATPTVSLGVTGYNLLGADDEVFGRAIGAGLALTPGTKFLLAADMRYDFAREAGRYGGGAEYLVTSGENGFPIRAGYLYDSEFDSSSITAGLGWVSARVGFDVGARFQVAGDGGDELLVQGALRLFLPN
jgi:hypothetical protein